MTWDLTTGITYILVSKFHQIVSLCRLLNRRFLPQGPCYSFTKVSDSALCLTIPLSMHFHKFSVVKFGFFQHFHFTDENIVKGINSLAGFFNVLANAVWDSVQKRRKIITAMCNGNKTFKINKCIHLGHTWFLGNQVLANIH